jgi:hypothetical protein
LLGFPYLEITVEDKKLPADLYDRDAVSPNDPTKMAYGKPRLLSSLGDIQKGFGPRRFGVQPNSGLHDCSYSSDDNRTSLRHTGESGVLLSWTGKLP